MRPSKPLVAIDRIRSINMRTLSCLLSVLPWCVAAPGQTVTLTAMQPIQVTTTHGSFTQTNAVPAGPITGAAFMNAVAGSMPNRTLADVLVQTQVAPHRVGLSIELYCDIDSPLPSPPASANISLDLRMVIGLPAGTGLRFSSLGSPVMPGLTPSPAYSYDFGDNGTVEFANGWWQSPTSTSWLQVVGAGGLPVRVRVDFNATQVGQSFMNLNLEAVPSFASATQYAPGCSGINGVCRVRFDRNIEYAGYIARSEVAVFGLSVQPVVLGAVSTPVPAPCLLIPSPDLLVWLPAGSVPYVLTIPPQAFPLDLWCQGVQFGSNGLETGNAYRAIVN